ncbi:MAG: phage scaffolding protein [Tissierellales bacterium]|jgi:hypothetical protein|nr:phage scaffolding protein [Tissierellales bacterium]MBN2828657.1 phage scaffolding protein [Tissierellales bacterium]
MDIEGIKKAADDYKIKAEKAEADMKDLKMNSAIKLALVGKVHDEDLTAGLFDKSKLIFGDDGKITGLEEQIKTFKESKAYLFKTRRPEPKTGI